MRILVSDRPKPTTFAVVVLLRGIRCLPSSLNRTRSPIRKYSFSADIIVARNILFFSITLGRIAQSKVHRCEPDHLSVGWSLLKRVSSRSRTPPLLKKSSCDPDRRGPKVMPRDAGGYRKSEITLDTSVNRNYIPAVLYPLEDVSRSSRNVGHGMRWTPWRQVGSYPPDETPRRTAKSCGPGAATLASSRLASPGWRRWQKRPLTGESTYKP